jgi:hypothetical protein
VKTIGRTSSGKPVYAAFQMHRDFESWTANDHHDAAEAHRDAARTDIKTNISMHENSAALHDAEAQRIYSAVERLGLTSRKPSARGSRKPSHATRKKSGAQLEREIAEVLAKKPRGNASHATRAAPRPTPYRIKLTPSELRAVEFAQGRYAWPDMLSAHAAEDGSIAFTENEMWQWTDDVDSDAEGGHSPFPLASDAFADKLQRFYDERI